MITVIDCFLVVGEIDIGSEAIERYSSFGAPTTLINKNSPANASGKVTSVEIYASLTGDLENCEIAAFYRPDPVGFPDKFTTRDTYTIGAVTGGSKQTFEVDLDLEKGDYLGITFSGGSIEYSPGGSGYLGVWSKGGDNIPCVNTDFGAIISGATVSLSATNAVSPNCKSIDCNLHVNENDDNFFGKIIDCSLTVQRVLVEACLATAQSIRLKITIDDEDVSAALVGQVMIQHNENLISLFSFNLGDFQYSPLLVGDYEDKKVIITSYVNGQEVKLFTGLIDGTRSDAGGKYNLYIYGSGYARKLLKRMTLISVQEAATAKTRGAIIRYLANQAGITDIEVPTGSTTVIDHSFQDQFVFDMMMKECMIEGWVMREDENGKIIIYEKIIKTNETLYPTPDWEYGENKFILIGLDTTKKGIINQITILGAIFEEEIITIETEDPEGDTWGSKVDVPDEEYDIDTHTINKSFSLGETVNDWSYEDANFKVTTKYIGYTKPPGYIFPKFQDYKFIITKLNSDLTVQGMEFAVTGGAGKYWEGSANFNIHREIQSTLDWVFTEKAFSISIVIKTKEQTGGGSVWITENLPNEETTSTIIRTQIKAVVNDLVSQAKYGVRKPPGEGTEEYTLAETEAQCKAIGQRRIRDSHRYIKQPDYSVNFNPKITVSEVVKLADNRIGYNERWYIEENILLFDIDPETGAIKPRSRIGCVFYA